MVTPSSSTISTGSASCGTVIPVRCAPHATIRVASTYAAPAHASAATGARTDRNLTPTISAIASTVNSSTQPRSRLMICPCSYCAATGPVTPTTCVR